MSVERESMDGIAGDTSTTDLSLNLLCGHRGYHVYQTVWTPRLNGVLSTEHESNNLYAETTKTRYREKSIPMTSM